MLEHNLLQNTYSTTGTLVREVYIEREYSISIVNISRKRVLQSTT
jgi:hypothetical protein